MKLELGIKYNKIKKNETNNGNDMKIQIEIKFK